MDKNKFDTLLKKAESLQGKIFAYTEPKRKGKTGNIIQYKFEGVKGIQAIEGDYTAQGQLKNIETGAITFCNLPLIIKAFATKPK